jgi:asparagine synthase (glutamine-hydrolysing)
MKHVLKQALGDVVPASIRERQDKMGFPVPFQEWLARPGPVRDFVYDVLSSDAARGRALIDNRKVLAGLSDEPKYGRKIWGLLCLELWQRSFHDQESTFKGLARKEVLA